MECICRIALCGLFFVSPLVQADVFAGKNGNAVASNTLMRFTDDQSGDVPPATNFGGALSGLISAHDMAWRRTTREIYVADFTGQAIRVYAQQSGDAAAVRTISGAHIGQPRSVVLVPEHNELLVITNLCCVSTFAIDANGELIPVRKIGNIGNVNTRLGNPSGLAYNPATDEVYVGEYFQDDTTVFAEVLVFPRTANGDVVPSRVIAGSNTLMGTYVVYLDFNPVNNEIYVLTDGPLFGDPYIVSTFAAGASGNVAPLRRITGVTTELNISTSLSFDAVNDRIVVTNDPYNAITVPDLLFFPRAANGNVAPATFIRGAQTGTSLGDGWQSVLAVDLTFLFEDGFE